MPIKTILGIYFIVVVFIALFLLPDAADAELLSIEDAVVNRSYTMCINDWRCSDRFFLKTVDSSQRHFNYMLNRFMAERNLMRFTLSDINLHPEMWLEVLCGASFCSENKIYVESRGCICESGKLCDEVDANNGYKELVFVGGVAILSGWCSWNTYYVLRNRNSSKNRRRVDKSFDDSSLIDSKNLDLTHPADSLKF